MSRQFRAGILFLEFLAAENLKKRFPPLLDLRPGVVSSGFLAAENLKSRIPAPLFRGTGRGIG